MIRIVAVIAVCAMASACTDRGAERTADSARVLDSVNAAAASQAAESAPIPDPGPAFPDSVSAPANTSGNLGGETIKSGGTMGQRPPDGIIGRDSAYGPIGTIDSK